MCRLRGMSDIYPFHLFDKRPNTYGFSGLDRAAHLREPADWLEQIMAGEAVRLVPIWRSRTLFAEVTEEAPRAALLDAARHAAVLENATIAAFLGHHRGAAHVAVDVSGLEMIEALEMIGDETLLFDDLRRYGPLMERFEASVLAYARGLIHWHQRHRFCGVCGSPTAIAKGGHQRNCTSPSCGAPHFPRTDPAVIMLVHDGDRALLGRQAVWPEGRYSTLAGFVEPGETLEEAVAREVFEETNIEVQRVRYHSSQPWPFPASIMLGFHAEARSFDIRKNDDELDDAQWFTKDQLMDFEAIGKHMPSKDSIARRLIEDWLAGK